MIDEESRAPVHVPTREELRACVVLRPKPAEAPPPEHLEAGAKGIRLSRDAERFLREAALRGEGASCLETLWEAVGIASGAVKKRVLSELRGAGFIRLERKGGAKAVYLYTAGWDYVGLKPPAGRGRGGSVHRYWVERLAGLFKRKGYDVRVEMEIGREKKRVDLVAFARDRIGIEVAMTSAKQEITNLKADLRSGVLDLVLLVSPDRVLLAEIQKRVRDDTYLCAHASRLKYYLLTEETGK